MCVYVYSFDIAIWRRCYLVGRGDASSTIKSYWTLTLVLLSLFIHDCEFGAHRKRPVLLLLYHLQQARKKKKRLSTRKKSKKNKLVTYPTVRDIPFPVCALLPSPFHDSQQNGLRIEKWIVFVYELNGGGSMVLLRFTLFIWDSARTIAHSRWPSLCSNARINQNMVQRYGLPD